jgi:hypothetical protein
MKKVWSKLRYGFVHNTDKLRIVVGTNNPVYGKECHVYVKDGNQEMCVYSVTQGDKCYDNWRYYNPKVEEDCLEILNSYVLKEDIREKNHQERLKKQKEDTDKLAKKLLDNY